MSHPVPATLYRIAAVAGCGSAAVLLINAAKRAEVIPTSAFTQLVAPLAQILALALVTGLYFAFGRRTGPSASLRSCSMRSHCPPWSEWSSSSISSSRSFPPPRFSRSGPDPWASR
jgi:hypothetical protein